MRVFRRFTKKQITLAAIVMASLLLCAALALTSSLLAASLADQQAALRWDSGGGHAQISAFFADGEVLDFGSIMGFRGQIERGLREASYMNSIEGARSYIDAYSSIGSVQIVSERTRLDTQAVGIGGDFFHFHPLELVGGTYFSGSELNKDAIIIDEEAAWQLFGASDVVGMSVTIGGVPHYVKGVVRRERGRMWEGAGLTTGYAYLSEESLAAYGTTAGIRHYEVVMPDPVSGFAYRLISENLPYSEDRMAVVDNSARYGIVPLLAVIADSGLRSMHNHNIRYPFWENHARGYEDILALILILEALLLLTAFLIVLVGLIVVYRRRSWTWPGLAKRVFGVIYSLVRRIRRKR